MFPQIALESNQPLGIFMEYRDAPVAIHAVNDTGTDLGEVMAGWRVTLASGELVAEARCRWAFGHRWRLSARGRSSRSHTGPCRTSALPAARCAELRIRADRGGSRKTPCRQSLPQFGGVRSSLRGVSACAATTAPRRAGGGA